ncbi:hypothetical protein [Candidatus Cardinium hertigii]|nr:hypothetical protein [Candidatus Cardinium hertigii]
MTQLRRYYMGCFFTLALISCSKLSNQAKRQPREAESTEEIENVRPQRRTTFQKNTKAAGIPKITTLILALLAASQIQLSSTSTEESNIIKEINFTAYEKCPTPIQIHLGQNFTYADMIRNINRWLSCEYTGKVPSCFNHIIRDTDQDPNPKNITTDCTKEIDRPAECKEKCIANLKGAQDFMGITNKEVPKEELDSQEYFFNSLPTLKCPENTKDGSTVPCTYSKVPFVQTYPNQTSVYHTLKIDKSICKPSKFDKDNTCTRKTHYEGLPDITNKFCSNENNNADKQEKLKEIAAHIIKFTEEQACTENPERTNAFITGSVQLYHQGRCLEKYLEFKEIFKSIIQQRPQESTTERTTTTTPGFSSSTFPSSTIAEYDDVQYEEAVMQSQQAQKKKRQIDERHTQRSKQNWKNSFLSHNSKQRKAFFRYH